MRRRDLFLGLLGAATVPAIAKASPPGNQFQAEVERIAQKAIADHEAKVAQQNALAFQRLRDMARERSKIADEYFNSGNENAVIGGRLHVAG